MKEWEDSDVEEVARQLFNTWIFYGGFGVEECMNDYATENDLVQGSEEVAIRILTQFDVLIERGSKERMGK